jgi:hypothetical protein
VRGDQPGPVEDQHLSGPEQHPHLQKTNQH